MSEQIIDSLELPDHSYLLREGSTNYSHVIISHFTNEMERADLDLSALADPDEV